MKRLLHVNTALNSGSHGRICEQISALASQKGWETTIVHSARYVNKSQFDDIQVTKHLDEIWHGIRSYLFDNHGLNSGCQTKTLIKKIQQLQPNVIHLHNIHGYYLNYKVLFSFLAKSKIPVVWTLHDCWSMTGHCAQFEQYGCEKWKTGCHDCAYVKKEYPRAIIDRSQRNYLIKRQCFTSVENMTVVPVSHWLANLVRRSFLAKYPIKVINNGIDIDKFRPKKNDDLRRKIAGDKKTIILGVASTWDADKGIQDFVELSQISDCQIVMVGVKDSLKKKLPKSIITIARTNSQEELAEYYSVADVFVNPTYKDTFPTVNIEAMACGTPVVTYQTGGSPESVTKETGIVVAKGDFNNLRQAIEAVQANGKHYYSTNCRERAVKYYNKDDRFKDYIELYENIINNRNI